MLPMTAAPGPLCGTGGGLELVAGGLEAVSVGASDESLDVGTDDSDDVGEDRVGDVVETSVEVEDLDGDRVSDDRDGRGTFDEDVDEVWLELGRSDDGMGAVEDAVGGLEDEVGALEDVGGGVLTVEVLLRVEELQDTTSILQ